MKKLNIETIIKILILLSFSVFYFKIIVNNEIIKYVHPRIVPFVALGIISMVIIALFLIKDSFHSKKKKIKIKNYIIFIIPLIMVFFMQSTNAESTTITSSDINANTNSNIISNSTLNKVSTNNTNQDNNSNNGSTFDLYEGKTETNGQGTSDKKNLDIKDNIINITPKNFVFSLDEILDNPDKYIGLEIEITGFVYKDKTLKENEFIVGRFMMVCCVADLQIAGLSSEFTNLEAYPNDTWIQIKGKIKNDTSNGTANPVIVVEHMEKDLNPDTSYVYPF
jgi:putative membrane protein